MCYASQNILLPFESKIFKSITSMFSDFRERIFAAKRTVLKVIKAHIKFCVAPVFDLHRLLCCHCFPSEKKLWVSFEHFSFMVSDTDESLFSLTNQLELYIFLSFYNCCIILYIMKCYMYILGRLKSFFCL